MTALKVGDIVTEREPYPMTGEVVAVRTRGGVIDYGVRFLLDSHDAEGFDTISPILTYVDARDMERVS